MQWKYAKRSLYTHAVFNQTEGKNEDIRITCAEKTAKYNNEKISNLLLYCKGEENMPVFKKTQINIMGKAYIFVYMYLNLSLLRNYEFFKYPHPTYRHRRFHIIYCKAQNRHFKSESIH